MQMNKHWFSLQCLDNFFEELDSYGDAKAADEKGPKPFRVYSRRLKKNNRMADSTEGMKRGGTS